MGYSKYEAQRVGNFASKLERAVYDMLRIMEACKEIKNIRTQTQVHLSAAKILYKPDFEYENCITGETEWAEAKGVETAECRIKRRLWIAYGPGKLNVWKGSYSKPYLHEVIEVKN